MERASESGLPFDPVYDDSKLTDFRPEQELGQPEKYPFTRGVYPRLYVDRPPVGPSPAERTQRAEGTDNPLRDARRADARLDEVCDALRDVWGVDQPYQPYQPYQLERI